MNFHPFHRVQDFLSLPITLRRVIKGTSQLQKTPRSGLILTERKNTIILISFLISPSQSSLILSLSLSSSPLLISYFPEKNQKM